MVAELDGQDLGVDGGGIDAAGVDQADGPLVEAGRDHRCRHGRFLRRGRIAPHRRSGWAARALGKLRRDVARFCA
jgi:hypothetical protein